ncbi:hypothetical protein HEP87_60845 [Streptomyces sp. S1D4-11]
MSGSAADEAGTAAGGSPAASRRERRPDLPGRVRVHLGDAVHDGAAIPVGGDLHHPTGSPTISPTTTATTGRGAANGNPGHGQGATKRPK